VTSNLPLKTLLNGDDILAYEACLNDWGFKSKSALIYKALESGASVQFPILGIIGHKRKYVSLCPSWLKVY